MEFDLDSFLHSYRPREKLDFAPYLELKKMEDYTILNKNSKKELIKLIPRYTYVKYIREEDAFSDEEYKNHVHCGGIFLAGGRFYNGKFKEMKDVNKWTHLLLKRQAHSIGKESTAKGYGMKSVYDHEIHIFKIIIRSNYIFYKYTKKLRENEDI